jgi:hypothetical protein
MKTVTWTKDSHGLFDYESSNLHQTKTKVDSSSHIYKEGNEILIKSIKNVEQSFDSKHEDKTSIFTL